MGKGAPDEAGTALPSGKPVHLMKCEKYPKKTSVKPTVSDIVQLRLPYGELPCATICRHVSSVDSVYTYSSLLYTHIYIYYRIIYMYNTILAASMEINVHADVKRPVCLVDLGRR